MKHLIHQITKKRTQHSIISKKTHFVNNKHFLVKNKNTKNKVVKNTQAKNTFSKYGIKQVCVSNSLSHLRDRVCYMYNLQPTINKKSDIQLFFGIYTASELNNVKQYNGIKYVMFGGSDVNDNYELGKTNLNYFKTNQYRTFFFAISKDIQKRLQVYDISSILIDFDLVDKSLFIPNATNATNATKIYIYDGLNKSTFANSIYGKNYYDEVIKRLPQYEYIFSSDLKVPYNKMPEIYAQCFIGLRLTEHDGNSNTVQEMKAMGIPIVHNYSDYGLKWKNVDDIVKYINMYNYEYSSVNTIHIDMYKISFLNNNTLQNINDNITNFNNLIKKYKKILFICGDYPGYGGAATNCYNLQQYYTQNGHNTFAFYYNFERGINAKYEKTDKYIISNLNMLSSIRFKPDLIILKSFVNYNLKAKFNCPIYYIIGGIYTNNLNKYYYDIESKEEQDTYINNSVINQIKKSDLTFVNSSHTQYILQKYYDIKTLLFYSSFISFVNKKIIVDETFGERKYDYGLIVSNFNRKIKNIEKSIDFLKDKENVILIGKNSKKYKEYGFECIDLVPHNKMNDYYKQIKYIVQDSFYESCSNVKIESLYNGCHIKPVIIISSTQYPGYGGAATNAYNIIKDLRLNGYNVAGVFFHTDINVNYDPDNIGGIFIYNYEFNKKNILVDTYNYLKQIPNVCLGKNYKAPLLCKNIFNCYTCYLVSGCNYLNFTNNSVCDANLFLNSYSVNPNLRDKKELLTLYNIDKIFTNSKLTYNIFLKIYPEFKYIVNKEIIDTTSINSYSFKNANYNYNKIYDITILCSNLNRVIKNNKFLINILKNTIFDKYKKCIIGQNYKDFEKIYNSTCYGLVSNKKCDELLSKSKLLLFPSFYDSNPNTVREAINNNCLPLITNNIGFSKNFPKYLICNDFTNIEWTNKILYILENYNNIKNIKINYKHTNDIYKQLLNNINNKIYNKIFIQKSDYQSEKPHLRYKQYLITHYSHLYNKIIFIDLINNSKKSLEHIKRMFTKGDLFIGKLGHNKIDFPITNKIYHNELINIFKNNIYPCFNEYQYFEDKIKQNKLFKTKKYSIPFTEEVFNKNNIIYYINNKYIDYPFIYKKSYGAGNSQVVKINNLHDINILNNKYNNDLYGIIQQYIPNNYTLRITVIGNKIFSHKRRNYSNKFGVMKPKYPIDYTFNDINNLIEIYQYVYNICIDNKFNDMSFDILIDKITNKFYILEMCYTYSSFGISKAKKYYNIITNKYKNINMVESHIRNKYIFSNNLNKFYSLTNILLVEDLQINNFIEKCCNYKYNV